MSCDRLPIFPCRQYSYIRSIFTDTWSGGYGAATHIVAGIKTFQEFVERYAKSPDSWQHGHLGFMCGEPCNYDFVLHTESLQEDFISLCKELGLPWPIKLPSIDEGGNRPVPSTNFTRSIIDKINLVDASIFDQFGYQRAIAPFSPHSPMYDWLSNQDIRGQPRSLLRAYAAERPPTV